MLVQPRERRAPTGTRLIRRASRTPTIVSARRPPDGLRTEPITSVELVAFLATVALVASVGRRVAAPFGRCPAKRFRRLP